MRHISLPKKFTVEESVPGKKARVIIEPCFPGYGLTIGNTLRRVLLSSLPGGAVTAVKINGVQHEFSALADISDDVLEIILNLKLLRVRVYGDEPVVLKLSAKGEGKVTGANVETSADAEVINKDLYITTINDKSKSLEMELTVAKGVGYVPTEDQGKGKGEIGVILIDSIFTPVVNVGLSIEATRVGQKTDYDKVILDIETDGTISPEEAVKKSAEIIVNQFTWVMEGGSMDVEEVDIEAPVVIPEAISMAEAMEPSEEVAIDDEGDEDGEDKPKKRGRPKKGDA